MPCAVCRRDCGPFPPVPEWLAPWRDHSLRACTIVCLSIIADRKDPMTDPTENEVAALEDAGDKAGEYLESLGKSDLAVMSRDEWMTLLEVVVTAFTDKLRELESAAASH